MKQEIVERLNAVRRLMAERNIDAVIVPQADPHQGEYLASHWQLRKFLSSFTGSAGDLAITADKALLWTDSRYFLQGAAQLDGTGIVLMRDGLPETPALEDWLVDNLAKGQTLGFDGMLFSADKAAALIDLMSRHGMQVVSDFDPAAVWTDRPALPDCPVYVHDIKYAGRSAADKLADILVAAKAEGADSVFISALDEIAWTLNLRSEDVRYNPVLTAFLYVAPQGTTLLIDPRKVDADVTAYLKEQGVQTAPYADVLDFIAAIPADARVLVETARNAKAIVDALGDRAVAGGSVVALPKACKNDVQIAGIRAAMTRDGVALVKAFMEIERRIAVGEEVTELTVGEILHKYRSEQALFKDESFGTIAGYGPHGAIVHYEADADSNATVKEGNLLLVDSGCQYLDGTTDITRTVAVGTPSDLAKRDFTLVMKGHIALATAIFPAGTTGHQLDSLARQFLWQNGLTYLHGTGHGVGQFLGVHEGPQSVRLNYVPTPLQVGMLTSNEPGLYRENVHGIRCENLVLTVPAMTTEFGDFLRFETLTVFPFDLNLFETSIMTDAEIAWLNDYHRHVRDTLSPLLNSAERTWLEKKTEKLVRR